MWALDSAQRPKLDDRRRPWGEDRRFLFVTAPFGPFSRRLAAALRQTGAQCERVLLNFGDVIDWGWRWATPFRGARGEFDGWIAAHMLRNRITDLVVHGDSHPYGVAAIRCARQLGLRVHVFEQGYFRPHWITLERDGVNARSTLPRGREAFADVPIGSASPVRPTGRITAAAVRWITRYHFAAYLGAPLFPKYRNPYSISPARQAIGHVTTYLSKAFGGTRSRAALGEAIRRPGPLFLVLLQRPGDSQLVHHSPFAAASDFIDQVLASFAAEAPAHAHLLFKAHPLDHGLARQDRMVAQASARLGLQDRVGFTRENALAPLLERAAGVVSVNSTAGLSGVEFGRPTIVLGRAIYDMEGLTHQGGLQTFWTAPQPPDRNLYLRFREKVSRTCQINGAFSTRPGMDLAIPQAVERLLGAVPVSTTVASVVSLVAPPPSETSILALAKQEALVG